MIQSDLTFEIFFSIEDNHYQRIKIHIDKFGCVLIEADNLFATVTFDKSQEEMRRNKKNKKNKKTT